MEQYILLIKWKFIWFLVKFFFFVGLMHYQYKFVIICISLNFEALILSKKKKKTFEALIK